MNFEAIKFEDVVILVEKDRKRIFVDDVRASISQFGVNEFSVSHVQAAFNLAGVVIGGKAPRNRISITLAKLVASGFITLVFAGAGNAPHKYRLK